MAERRTAEGKGLEAKARPMKKVGWCAYVVKGDAGAVVNKQPSLAKPGPCVHMSSREESTIPYLSAQTPTRSLCTLTSAGPKKKQVNRRQGTTPRKRTTHTHLPVFAGDDLSLGIELQRSIDIDVGVFPRLADLGPRIGRVRVSFWVQQGRLFFSCVHIGSWSSERVGGRNIMSKPRIRATRARDNMRQ